jgi:hypothetical protein
MMQYRPQMEELARRGFPQAAAFMGKYAENVGDIEKASDYYMQAVLLCHWHRGNDIPDLDQIAQRAHDAACHYEKAQNFDYVDQKYTPDQLAVLHKKPNIQTASNKLKAARTLISPQPDRNR